MQNKLRDAQKLIKSKCYILITDKEGTMAGDFKGFTGIMKINTLKIMLDNGRKLVKRLQEEDNVGNQSGRSQGRPKK